MITEVCWPTDGLNPRMAVTEAQQKNHKMELKHFTIFFLFVIQLQGSGMMISL